MERMGAWCEGVGRGLVGAWGVGWGDCACSAQGIMILFQFQASYILFESCQFRQYRPPCGLCVGQLERAPDRRVGYL